MKTILKFVFIVWIICAALPGANGGNSPPLEAPSRRENATEAKTENSEVLNTLVNGNKSIHDDLNSWGLNTSSIANTENSKYLPPVKEVTTAPGNDSDKVTMEDRLSQVLIADPDYITNLVALFGAFDDLPIHDDLDDEQQLYRKQEMEKRKQQINSGFELLKPMIIENMKQLQRNVTANNENIETDS